MEAVIRRTGRLSSSAIGLLTAICVGALVGVANLSPEESIVLLAALAAVLLFLRWPRYGLVAVIAAAPAYDLLRGTISTDVRFLGVWQDASVILFAGGTVLRSRTDGIQKPQWNLVDVFVGCYIAWSFGAALFSPTLTGGLYVWRWYALGPLLYLVFRFYRPERKLLRSLLIALSIGLGAACIFLIFESFVMGGQAAAAFTRSLGYIPLYRNGWRIAGSFSSPLVASAAAGLLVILGAALLDTRGHRPAALVLIGVGAVGSAVTLSRSGWVIAAVGVLGIVLARPGRRFGAIIVIMLLGVAATMFLSRTDPSEAVFTYATGGNSDDMVRVDRFQQVLVEAATRYPLGVGFSQGGSVSATAGDLFHWTNAIGDLGGDSVLIANLRSEGWPGMLFLLFALAGALRSAWLAYRECGVGPERMFLGVSLAFLLGSLAALVNLMDVWPLKAYLWILSAGAVSIADVRGVNHPLRGQHRGRARPRRTRGLPSGATPIWRMQLPIPAGDRAKRVSTGVTL